MTGIDPSEGDETAQARCKTLEQQPVYMKGLPLPGTTHSFSILSHFSPSNRRYLFEFSVSPLELSTVANAIDEYPYLSIPWGS